MGAHEAPDGVLTRLEADWLHALAAELAPEFYTLTPETIWRWAGKVSVILEELARGYRTGFPCGCAFVRVGKQWWHVIACPDHELNFGSIEAVPLTPSADMPACRDEDPAHAATRAACYPDPPEYQHPEDDAS